MVPCGNLLALKPVKSDKYRWHLATQKVLKPGDVKLICKAILRRQGTRTATQHEDYAHPQRKHFHYIAYANVANSLQLGGSTKNKRE